MRNLLLMVSAAAAGIALLAEPRAPKGLGPLDQRIAPYLEDLQGDPEAVPRAVAEVEAVLFGNDEQAWLQLNVSAKGPVVEPIPGLTGVPGVNLRTAEELHQLLGEEQLRLVTREPDSARIGTLVAVTRQRLPVRRMLPDGNLDLSAVAPTSLPAKVTFASQPLPRGRSHTYLVARDMPRLLVEVERDARGGRIVAIESLGIPFGAPPR
ncbi:MAG: hypothetical protein VYE77_00540 [Planctomycetota bacterium]|nr:hypothetical protein [Planctomycetota bacterium]